jgi:WD40 repeat protein
MREVVRVLDATTFGVKASLRPDGAWVVRDVAFTRDGARLVTASESGTLAEYATDGALVSRREADLPLVSVDVSPDGARVAAAVEDGRVVVLRR